MFDDSKKQESGDTSYWRCFLGKEKSGLRMQTLYPVWVGPRRCCVDLPVNQQEGKGMVKRVGYEIRLTSELREMLAASNQTKRKEGTRMAGHRKCPGLAHWQPNMPRQEQEGTSLDSDLAEPVVSTTLRRKNMSQLQTPVSKLIPSFVPTKSLLHTDE